MQRDPSSNPSPGNVLSGAKSRPASHDLSPSRDSAIRPLGLTASEKARPAELDRFAWNVPGPPLR
jgi:hypothetical protein